MTGQPSRSALRLLFLLLFLPIGAAAQAPPGAPLRVVSAGPNGEIASAAEANEIRVVFSQPMIAIGRVPAALRPDFFRITPAVEGKFRWSGTTILFFTPSQPLPLSTKYDVTIAASAASASGRTLGSPYTFTFTTPTVKLLSTDWYRPDGRYDTAPIVALRFNQPVNPDEVLRHLHARFESHDFVAPPLTQSGDAFLRANAPGSLAAFDRKVAQARAAASATSPVAFVLARDWDRKRFVPSPDLVVVQATTPVPVESWVRVELDGRVPSPAGLATPGRPQSYTIKANPAFLVLAMNCESACDPDGRNPIVFSVDVKTTVFGAALRASDVTDPRRPSPIARGETPARQSWQRDEARYLTVEDAGFQTPRPASTWLVTLPPTLQAADGQTLGYTWAAQVENWHQRAFTSFGDGHGVWEKGGGAVLPFYARNMRNVRQWTAAIDPQSLMPTLQRLQGSQFGLAPDVPPVQRRLGLTADRIQSHGLDLSGTLNSLGSGIVWAAVEEGDPIAQSRASRRRDESPMLRATVVQVTNLGISVKDSPQGTLLFVTRLDTAAPVAGARVSIVAAEGEARWTGTTANDGVAMAPPMRLRDPRRWYDEFAFIATAEKDGDVAYTASDWYDGMLPWAFGLEFNLRQADPLLCGTVFTDRGVYKLGEEVHAKAILRSNTPGGVRPLPEGTAVQIKIKDDADRTVEEQTIKVNAWSSAELRFTVPAEGSLGRYAIHARLAGARPDRADDKPDVAEEEGGETFEAVTGSFLVAAYRRPDFRVDVTLKGESRIAGDPLSGLVKARYLFGASMGVRPVAWQFKRTPVYSAPAAILDKFPSERWTFVGMSEGRPYEPQLAGDEAQLTATGDLALTLDTPAGAGVPFTYTLEGDVEDVSRQHIANRASLVVHPAPWYIGVRNVPMFAEQKDGLKTEVVTVGLDGRPVAGVAVDLTLTQIQWHSVRRAEGNGFYGWETERKEVPSGSWHVTTTSDPVPLTAELPSGGYFILTAHADAGGGRSTETRMSFYALGAGYTAWERYDHNRIDLVAERTTYKPGETARVMIQSPWEQATALVTTEREGIRTHRQFALTSTQQSIEVPITEADIPNVYVSVLLVKGRSVPLGEGANAAGEDSSDPGKPSFRLGYVQLKVEDATRRLAVKLSANREEYRPASNAKVNVDVKDHQGRPAASEVTLWAVDYGVLSLTAYRTPDVLGSVYVEKALQVLTEDGRQKIVSRRVITPKGDAEAGDGTLNTQTSAVGERADFRVMAFWLGSVVTDARGHASADVKLPESLTTYRIMAVAADRDSRFGSADAEVRINKPLTLKAAFPRFLAVGDKATFGAVLTNQLAKGGNATVTIESLDPQFLRFAEGAAQKIDVAAGGSVEVRFDAAGLNAGRARVRMTAKLGGESDAFQDVIPVEILVSPETVSAIGQADATTGNGTVVERLAIPAGVVSTFGGLRVDLASTALVGLGEGARYLVEYPYGCAEQRGSRALALMLSADLGDAFKLPGIDTAKGREAVQAALRELERFQCEGNGGFAYWPGECHSVSPYLTAYLLHVFKVARDLKYTVNPRMVDRAADYLESSLAQKPPDPPDNEGWWPAYTAWQAFAVKVLVETGRKEDSHLTRLYGYRDRMPVFALAYLNDALVAKGEAAGVRSAELRRLMGNAILPEAAMSHVEEVSDPYLMWFWNSNVRSTAIVLNSLVTANAGGAQYRGLVAWLLNVRKHGRWGNTQENALALEALVSYYRRFEATVPDFTGSASLGGSTLTTARFEGRSTEARGTDIPMAKVLASGPAGAEQPLSFTRSGQGTLFYSARLRYAVDTLFHEGADQGITIERSYAPFDEKATRPPATTFNAGDLVKVTLTLRLTKERRYVAVTDPLPAGLEAVESWFATSAQDLADAQEHNEPVDGSWFSWWQRGGFDHVERHDDRVQLFATRLSEGEHVFTYIARATTSGTFRTAPAHAEEMYQPEVFGRTATATIEVRK